MDAIIGVFVQGVILQGSCRVDFVGDRCWYVLPFVNNTMSWHTEA